ncbi:unnamed protein product, partial [marine sediment metagenome]
MATKGTGVYTLMDHAKLLDPNGKIARTIALLSQDNRILDDMLFKEGNLPNGEQTTIDVGLPEVFYRLMNMGTPNSKAVTAQITENAAQLEGRSEVDVKVANMNGNVGQFRLNNAMKFLEAMNQKQAQTLIYGTNLGGEEYVGIAPRYSDLSASNGQNILDAGGTGSDNTSIFLVGWGMDKVFGVFPKGSKAGVSHQNLGEIDAFDANDNRFRAYSDLWQWDNGLVVKDWRYIVRVANIDVPDLVG